MQPIIWRRKQSLSVFPPSPPRETIFIEGSPDIIPSGWLGSKYQLANQSSLKELRQQEDGLRECGFNGGDPITFRLSNSWLCRYGHPDVLFASVSAAPPPVPPPHSITIPSISIVALGRGGGRSRERRGWVWIATGWMNVLCTHRQGAVFDIGELQHDGPCALDIRDMGYWRTATWWCLCTGYKGYRILEECNMMIPVQGILEI